MAEGLMAGKRGLIMGVANKRSIAWGIAKALADQGAEIAFSYQGEALKKRVEPLAAEIGVTTLVECDVTNDAAMDETFRVLKEKWGTMDFLVHAIGFSDKNELEGRYIDTSAGNFALTMNISVYSFTAVAKRAEAMLNPGALAADAHLLRRREVRPQLQRHGRRQGRARSLGALPRGRPGPEGHPRQRHLRRRHQDPRRLRHLRPPRHAALAGSKAAPLKRNVTQDEVGTAALYLLSDLASGVTGQIQYVDAASTSSACSSTTKPAAAPAPAT